MLMVSELPDFSKSDKVILNKFLKIVNWIHSFLSKSELEDLEIYGEDK